METIWRGTPTRAVSCGLWSWPWRLRRWADGVENTEKSSELGFTAHGLMWGGRERKGRRRVCQKFHLWVWAARHTLHWIILWKEFTGVGWQLFKMCPLHSPCFPLFLSTVSNVFTKWKNVTLYWLLTWIFSTLSKTPKLCTRNTQENRNSLSWKIRNLENHYWIILRSVEAIAFCLSCHSLAWWI